MQTVSLTNPDLEQQVCSLHLAKRLKELGVKQDSIFNWGANSAKKDCEICYGAVPLEDEHENGIMEIASAFTVAELGKMLVAGQGEHMLTHRTAYAHYAQDESILKDTEADARAKMLIYLLENKLVTL
jgi:hypothetical protein